MSGGSPQDRAGDKKTQRKKEKKKKRNCREIINLTLTVRLYGTGGNQQTKDKNKVGLSLSFSGREKVGHVLRRRK